MLVITAKAVMIKTNVMSIYYLLVLIHISFLIKKVCRVLIFPLNMYISKSAIIIIVKDSNKWGSCYCLLYKERWLEREQKLLAYNFEVSSIVLTPLSTTRILSVLIKRLFENTETVSGKSSWAIGSRSEVKSTYSLTWMVQQN